MATTQSTTRKRAGTNKFRAVPKQHKHVQLHDPLREDLMHLVRTLQLTVSVVNAAVMALRQQCADQDEDIALVLQRNVSDALWTEVEKWEALLKLQGYRKSSVKH